VTWLRRRGLLALLLLLGCTTQPAASRPPLATRAPTPPTGADGAAELVELTSLAPGVRLDIRYARTDNFTGVAVYPAARCLLRRDVAERVARVQAGFAQQGLGLLVWDCYRPFPVQERFWALVPDERYVAKPERRNGVPVAGSKHNRGAAIDLTLVDAQGVRLEMPTDFDDFSERAHRDARSASPTARANARRLEAAMQAEGFTPLPTEWWHFDGPNWQAYPLE
jgi:beta-N-acetylhexosaminidase/D-alanyl-D-alanine dipeptidase